MRANQQGQVALPELSNSGTASKPASRPLYLQVKEHLIQRVLSGEWKPGERLPSEIRLAEGYGLSQGTIRKAIGEMAKDGLVGRWAGRGTFVNSHNSRANRPFRFNSIYRDDGQRMAGQPTTYVKCQSGRAGERIAVGLGIGMDDQVSEIIRIRLLEGKPVLVETTYISEQLCPGVSSLLLEHQPDSIYKILEQAFNILVTRVEEKVRARAANEEESAYLSIPAGTAVLEIERTAFSLGGERVEWRTIVCETNHFHYMNQQNR